MVNNIIKTFKLNYDGTFDEIAYENIKNVFTIVNILAIYIQNKKIMYIWIGKRATQALKNYVARIREQIKEEFPDFRIIRNITFDMRSEPYEFFKNLEMTKEELFEQIEYQEKVILPVLEKIEDLKLKSNKFIEVEDYKKAITFSKKIIKLAKKIKDEAQVMEYENLILDLTQKQRIKILLGDINNDFEDVRKKYTVLIRTKDFLQTHQLLDDFIKKYEDLYDISQIKSVQELIEEEKKVWNRELDKILKKLERLETDYSLSLKRSKFTEAKEFLSQAKELLPKLINTEIHEKWEKLEQELSKATIKDDLIERIEHFLEESIELKQNYKFGELKEKNDELLNQIKKLDIKQYLKVLNNLKTEIISAEEFYLKTTNKINELINQIDNNKNSKFLENQVKDCEEIIKLANSINNSKIIKKYTDLCEKTKKEIHERKECEDSQNDLKQKLKNLENDFKSSFEIMDLNKVKDILKKGERFLSELKDDEIRERWSEFNLKYHSAKDLLSNIESLSNKGIKALDKGTYSKSLDYFERIIYQLQEYNN